MNAVAKETQTALDETVLEDANLELALNNRQQRKDAVKAARKEYAEEDGKVRGLLAAHDLQDDTAVRIGRFRITKKAVASRSVQFETDPTSRITISLLPE